jgi:transcriptional regulator with XRE-family HTH domain
MQAASGESTTFAGVLRAIMTRAGLNPQRLAAVTGTSASLVSRWLSGHVATPTRERVAQFAAPLVWEHPDTADLADSLFRSLGYLPASLPLPPQVVIDNWHRPEVRRIWHLPGIGDDAREGMVQYYAEHTGEQRRGA